MVGAVALARAMAEGAIAVDGDPGPLGLLMSLLAPVDPDFAIVTP